MPLLALLGSACGSATVVAPPDDPCIVPTTLRVVDAPGLSQPSLRSALFHAAGPMTSALGTSVNVRELQRGINDLVSAELVRADVACRGIMVATKALDAMPDDPATRPDRDGIRLVLGLAVHAFEVQPTREAVVAD
jgi:hypothetical protein